MSGFVEVLPLDSGISYEPYDLAHIHLWYAFMKFTHITSTITAHVTPVTSKSFHGTKTLGSKPK